MTNSKIKIGVFDSGMGGLSVANAINKALPGYEIIFRHDNEHLPYGSKPAQEILGYVKPILQDLVDEGCAVIVIACNTVTTTLIDTLRELFDLPIVGIEPMIKPAAKLTKSNVIAVCATPTTLASKRYKKLKNEINKNIKIVEPDCSDWAYMIENNKVDYDQIKDRIESAINLGADTIVLACTHYHWIEEEIKTIAAGRAKILQPEDATIKQLKTLLDKIS